MADLLKPDQVAAFTKAIADVTDTFFQREVIFRQYPDGYDAMGRLVKNAGGTVTKDDRTVLGMIETLSDMQSRLQFEERGAVEEFDYNLTFNVKDLIAAGLMDVNQNWLFGDDILVLFEGNFHQIVWRSKAAQLKDKYLLVEIRVDQMPPKGDY